MFNFKDLTKAEMLVIMQRLFMRQGITAVILCAIAYFAFGGRHAYLFLFGLLWAMADDSLVFGSAYKGMGQTARQNKVLLKLTFLVRIALAVVLVFIILRMKLGLLEVFLGFVLMHICFILNLLLFTRQNKNTTAVEKGGKDGSC